MIGPQGEVALSGEAEAALSSLGKAGASLAVGESEAALVSVTRARAILIPATEPEAALVAVNEARTALFAGDLENAMVAVREAQAALSATVRGNSAAALALAALSQAEAELESAEKSDNDLGITEKAKIDEYEQLQANRDPDAKFFAGDLSAALEYLAQYKTSMSNGRIRPTGTDRVIPKGCESISHTSWLGIG
jgi:hypothetical protein